MQCIRSIAVRNGNGDGVLRYSRRSGSDGDFIGQGLRVAVQAFVQAGSAGKREVGGHSPVLVPEACNVFADRRCNSSREEQCEGGFEFPRADESDERKNESADRE